MLPDRSAGHSILGESCLSRSHRAPRAVIAAVLALSPIAALTALAAISDAVDDAYSTNEDTALTVSATDGNGLLANDTTDGGTLCVTGFNTTGLQGSLDSAGVTDGSFTYTPPVNWNGTTTFTYDVAAVTVGVCPVGTVEDTATVTIMVNAVNDPPTAVAESFSALAGHTLNVASPGVLANDSDIDGDVLTAVKVNSPAHGVLTLAAEGGFSYTPASGYTGPDAFSYKASDGSLQSATRIVSLTVSAIPPNATPTPQPTPTPAPPTASPEPSQVESALPSDSGFATPQPLDTGLLPSASPSASPATSPASGQGPGLPLLAVGALVLLIGLLAVAGVFFVRSQRSEGDEAFETDGYGSPARSMDEEAHGDEHDDMSADQ
jgi:hypothetical protein